jgi:hypothetical protein
MSDLSERLGITTYRWPNGRVVARLIGKLDPAGEVAGLARYCTPNVEARPAPEPGAGNGTHLDRAQQPAVPQ